MNTTAVTNTDMKKGTMTMTIAWSACLALLALAGTATAQPARPGLRAPVAPVAPLAPLAPAPPAPPLAGGFPHLDTDFNFDFDFDFDFDLDSNLDIDIDAIRESARSAAETAMAVAKMNLKFSRSQAPTPPTPPTPNPNPFSSRGRDREGEADGLYTQARQLIDQGRYERAIDRLDRLTGLQGATRIDAALYWKSYAQAKQGLREQALATLADMQKRFADSRWLKDAKALEVEVRQASGQAVSPDSQNDEELKLLALRGLLQSDAERALPMIEKLLAGNGSVKLRENALFVLIQSRTPKAREIITGIAKGGANPDLQLRAIRYLGAIGGTDGRQLLGEIYGNSTDRSIKRSILQSLHASDGVDQMMEIARNEKDPELRRIAIRNLGAMGTSKTGDALRRIYLSDTNGDLRRAVIQALHSQDAAPVLVELARTEKDPVLKREIVQRLSNIKSKEAADYLLELLK